MGALLDGALVGDGWHSPIRGCEADGGHVRDSRGGYPVRGVMVTMRHL